MNHDLTKPSLLLRVRDAADAEAWSEFETRYRELIVRYARARGLQPADADDVCQAVMIKLCRTLRAFEYDPRRGRFRTYLYRAVKNEIAEQLSRPKQRQSPVETHEDSAPHTGAARDEADVQWELEWEDHHLRLAMQTIRATFDPASVAVFERLLAGDSAAVVAEAFKTTPAAVNKIKQRIRDRMSELIARQVADEDGLDGPQA